MVLSGPLAVIKVNGKEVGYMKDYRYTENVRRGRVQGLGRLSASEAPAQDHSGDLSCSFYTINLIDSGIPGAERRVVNGIEQWSRGILFDQIGVDVVLLKKVPGTTVDPVNGIADAAYEEIGTARKCFIESRSLNVSEGQLSGSDQRFTVLDPIIL